MTRRTIESLWERRTLNNVNANFTELYNEKDSVSDMKRDIEDVISNAQEINKQNKNVEKALNDLVVEAGTSDAEVVQARGTHQVLNERLNTMDSEIINAENEAHAYLEKTEDISVKSAYAYKMMNTSPEEWLGNEVTICVWGNSLGAGNGGSYSWPDRLKNTLDRYSRHGQTITIINRSIGGYYASQVNDEFPEPSGADISIISFGTNEYNKVQRSEEYSGALEKIIDKEVSGGSTVVLTTMPQWGSKDWQVKASNGSMEDYNQIVHDIGNKYNIPVLDLFKETRNLDWSAFKTGEAVPHIHLNDLGYQMISEKVAAFIGFQPPNTLRKLKNGDFLGVRAGVDGIKFVGDYQYISQASYYPTPAETTEKSGTAISTGNDEKTFHYAVNIDEDNLLLYPNFNFTKTDGSESLTIYINNRNNPFLYSNPYMFYNSINRNTATNTQVLKYTNFNTTASPYHTQNIYANPNMQLFNAPFATKGHYVITVKATNCDFFGFDCVAGNVAGLLTKRQDTGWVPLKLTGVENTDANKPSAYRKVTNGTTTEIFLRIAVNGETGQAFATLPSGVHPGQLTRLPAFSGTTNSGLVIGGTGNLVSTTGDSHDFRCTQSFII
ncbi:hypothetical protein KGO5_06237 [Sinorhizobium sp. KGO-5]|uniref:SGNH/GDSL hydrolase family protein n=1 Tax=Sinorhizobium sp. KGO-5 TaxID=1470810 RepID=UPI00294A44DA|nr:hypothetical protein KGO5_06237 [Sinorhizobium sp. KGO-5]